MSARSVFIDYLRDILDAVEKIEEFTLGMEYAEFALDNKTIYAVVRALEIIGEATKQIPEPLRRKYATVPWREMARMRDKLIHQYFGVDLQVVWKTVRNDLTPLKSVIIEMIRNEDN
jgi:uncharacterized protein with HEPN domain